LLSCELEKFVQKRVSCKSIDALNLTLKSQCGITYWWESKHDNSEGLSWFV